MTMSRNSSSLVRRPRALTVRVKSTGWDMGIPPTTPAATCTFCSRMAPTTSVADNPRAATLCGSSQTRMA
jgi:hypothetical protein